ncbi:MAG: 50S ribosomal protein L23 [Candidatus Fischerbacteria bacterium RBG_13_37_8]|uniref:Large ribosomal subunit protein uL23 n=1 Tax=Candidatus Fischerbacteria bacterium RBG_13_37_8 TaxID=1817863 RepID=A0A1F5VE28_9BACT|nr:MAG: 50S ribosomal protein L23 [Candidatus Fischerbacteria bacterium RBG_13_37_8]
MREPYSILLKPILTEKALQLQEERIYCFSVDRKANKLEVKNAVEKIFGVKVEVVKIINIAGKKRSRYRREGFTSSWKKAYVKLKEGEKALDFTVGA